MNDTTNVSMRLPADLVDRIDENAARAGETRTTYILSWLPEYYDIDRRHRARNAENGTTPHSQDRR